MKAWIKGLSILLATPLVWAGPAAARPAAMPDSLVTVERLALEFPETHLLANDQHGVSARVVIASSPASGTVSCGAGLCIYQPAAGFHGEDAFTYRVVEDAGSSLPVMVRVRVTPVVVPLAGDWNGDGQQDLGWFDSLCQTLFLAEIDWLEAVVESPLASQLPLPAGSLGWIPYVGDWDADSRDDVGVFDPVTGAHYQYVQQTPDLGWALHATLAAGPGAGQGGLPVAGDWSAQDLDQAALYLPQVQQFLLLVRREGTRFNVPFQVPPANDWLPVVGDWGGTGEGPATTALFSPSQKRLLVSDHSSLNPVELHYHDEPAGLLPFVGNWGMGESIGFYLPSAEEFGSFVLYPCDFAEDQCGGRVPLPIGPPPADPPLADGCPLRHLVYGD